MICLLNSLFSPKSPFFVMEHSIPKQSQWPFITEQLQQKNSNNLLTFLDELSLTVNEKLVRWRVREFHIQIGGFENQLDNCLAFLKVYVAKHAIPRLQDL